MTDLIEKKLNAGITLIAFIIVTLKEILFPGPSIYAFLFKIFIVLLLFWFIIGKCFARLAYLIASEFVEEDQAEERDCRRREMMASTDQDDE